MTEESGAAAAGMEKRPRRILRLSEGDPLDRGYRYLYRMLEVLMSESVTFFFLSASEVVRSCTGCFRKKCDLVFLQFIGFQDT